MASLIIAASGSMHLFACRIDRVVYKLARNSKQFRRYLAGKGCTFEVGAGKGGHIVVRFGDRSTTLPQHGSAKQLGTGLMNAIKKQLGVD